MQKKLDTAADLCRIMFLLTAVSLLWGVEGVLGRDRGDSAHHDSPRSGQPLS